MRETRTEYRQHDFYYKVIIPVEEFPRGLFVELILVDADPEVPTVQIVNAHEQKH